LPVDTALGRHVEPERDLSFPPSHQWIAFGTHHLDLLNRTEVYEKIRSWLAQARCPASSAGQAPSLPPADDIDPPPRRRRQKNAG